jgi:hypothetical protein
LLPLSFFCCCGVTRFTQGYIDASVPRLGTAIGLFVTASLAAFYLAAAVGAALTHGEPFRVRYGAAVILAGTLLGGAGLTWLVMDCFPRTKFERHAGLIGFGLLLFVLAILPFHIIENRRFRLLEAQARQDELERIRSGEAPVGADAEPPDP